MRSRIQFLLILYICIAIIGCEWTLKDKPKDNANNAVSTIQIQSARYQVTEQSGRVSIDITRSGSSQGSVDVEYRTDSGSALASADFQAVQGNLHWDDGELGGKTIEILIVNDSTPDNNEEFTFSLFNSIGAEIGLAVTTINIQDGECQTLNSNITSDTVLDGCYTITRQISISNALLTINAGSLLIFQANTGFNVQQDGALAALGTVNRPITFTGEQKTAGYWQGIRFSWSNNLNNVLQHSIIEFAGGQTFNAAVDVLSSSVSPSRVSINNTVVSDSLSAGFSFANNTILSFSQNSMLRNSVPVTLGANNIGNLDTQSNYAGNSADHIEIKNGSLSVDQTWQKLDVPYYLGTQRRNVSANQIILAGNQLIFGAGGGLSIQDTGSVKAVGLIDKRIVFTGEQQTPGYWLGIELAWSNDINNEFEFVTIEYAGGGNNKGALNILSSSVSQSRIKFSNSVISDSLSYGFSFPSSTLVDKFDNNVFIRNENGPGWIDGDASGALDSSNDYSGNTIDHVVIGSSTIRVDTVWPRINVDYFLEGNRHTIDSHLTIERGNRLIFEAGSSLYITGTGALTAQGDAANPILFTGDQATPGYWDGIQFAWSNNLNNLLDYVQINYAGGGSLNGSVHILSSSVSPSRVTINNSEISNSGSYGIYVGQNAIVNDFLLDNTFTNNTSGSVFYQ